VTRLLIGNDFLEDLTGVTDARQKKSGWWPQRLLWYAKNDDILVLPSLPDDGFFDYVTALTGTRRSSLRIVVPPAGRLGVGLLTTDRLADPDFRDGLRRAVGGRPIDAVLALHPDANIAALARDFGADDALPGYSFLSQGGGRLVNSKAVFRAIAAGADVPLPEGAVCAQRESAEEAIARLITRGCPVMLKHEFRAGGRGNEILSPAAGLQPIGARRTVVCADRAEISAYLKERWDWLTDRGQHQLVVERYFPEHTAVFAEFSITDDGPQFGGDGEMLSAPMAIAEVMPTQRVSKPVLTELIEAGRRLCDSLYVMGYRGILSADAIVTADEQIVFTEYNGRVTGSTHIYDVIGKQIVGADCARNRVLFEREGWSAPSFQAALEGLAAKGLAYDPASRTGVVLVMAFNPTDSTIRHCIVAETLDLATECQRSMDALFSHAPA